MAETARYDASFKKVPGTLSLTPTHVAWVPTVAGAMDRQQQALARVTSASFNPVRSEPTLTSADMLASKPGSARTSLMLKFKDDVPAGGLLFTFTGAAKDADRQAVQDTLVPFVAANRASSAGTPVPAAAGTATGTGSAEATPSGSTPVSTPGTPASVARKRKAGDEVEAKARRKANSLREAVLRKNPTLKLLHRELVIGKQISEEEFWDGREALLKAEEMAAAQRPGRASRILDDRDWSGEKKDRGKIQGGTGVGKKKIADNAPVRINLTRDLVREIFDEFPVVQHAYAKYVPGVSMVSSRASVLAISHGFGI